MTTSLFGLTMLFLCGAALSLTAAAAGALLTMWCSHVAKTGCNPLPSMPKVRLFKRTPVDEDEDEETAKNNGQRAPRVGP